MVGTYRSNLHFQRGLGGDTRTLPSMRSSSSREVPVQCSGIAFTGPQIGPDDLDAFAGNTSGAVG
jgi:hypothetical protein